MKPDQNKKPPRWAAWLLFRLSHHEDRYSIADDLEIEYEELTAEKGSLIAWLWYVLHVFRAVPEYLMLTIYWSNIMLKNYLSIALRNMMKNKFYSFLNISGLE